MLGEEGYKMMLCARKRWKHKNRRISLSFFLFSFSAGNSVLGDFGFCIAWIKGADSIISLSLN